MEAGYDVGQVNALVYQGYNLGLSKDAALAANSGRILPLEGSGTGNQGESRGRKGGPGGGFPGGEYKGFLIKELARHHGRLSS